MTLSNAFEMATNAEFKELSNYSLPPRAGRVTAVEPSGQVRVASDDPDGGDVLAWPLNGFTYAVNDVVYIMFAGNSPDSAIVLGSKAPPPTLGGYALLSAANTFNGNQTVVGGDMILDNSKAARFKDTGGTARSMLYVSGLDQAVVGPQGGNIPTSIFGGSGIAGLTVFPSGWVGGGVTNPQGKFHLHDGTGGIIFVTKTGITNVAQTLIPDGAGDVTSGIIGFYVVDEGGGAVMNAFSLTLGSNLDVVIGGYTLRLALSAGGALTAVRQAGAGSAKLAVLAAWL